MPPPLRHFILVLLLGLLVTTGAAREIEVNPYAAGGITKGWKLTPEEFSAWTYENDVLIGETKAFKAAEAVYEAEAFPAFTLFVQISQKHRGAKIMLVPESGETVYLDITRKWISRKTDWTMLKIEVGEGKAVVRNDEDEEIGSFEVSDVPLKIGFHLRKGGKASFKRVRVVWDKPPEPKAEMEAGFADLLAGGSFDRNFRVVTQETAVPGEWKVQDNLLSARNPESHGSQKFTARLSNFGVADYELRFKLRTGAKNVILIGHFGIQGQPDTQKRWTLDGYCTGVGEWHSFVVTLKDQQITMSVNGLDVVVAEPTAGGRTGIAIQLLAEGRAEFKDLHIRSSTIQAGGGGGRPPAARGGQNAGGGSQELFNGKDLSNWAARPDDVWKATAGAIFGMNRSGNLASLQPRIRVRGDYKITFSVELGTTSLGFLVRANPDQRRQSVVQIPDDKLTKPWNKVEIVVQGAQARLLVEGTQVASVTEVPDEGFLGFLLAHGGACRIKEPKIGNP